MEETIAVSSQVMNRNNYRIVLEEILAVGNVDRKLLPPDVDKLSPPQQVSYHGGKPGLAISVNAWVGSSDDHV